MIYRDFKGDKLSALGLGTMRFPLIDGDDKRINEEKTAEIVDYTLKNGVNYFDTAWGYHGGNSEIVIGKLLSNYPRDSFRLATKFPGFDRSYAEKAPEIFEKQLEKCRVDYFDFYLCHNVTDRSIDVFLNPAVHDYILEQKKSGRIRHLGFSAHGSIASMRKFIEAYGDEIEFCQIQLNWLDWKLQDAKGKTEMLAGYGIPVWVMEPVRGGRLINIGEDENDLRAVCPDRDTAEWAFRFIQSLPNIGVTLSGMSNMDQIKENIAIFSENKPLTDEEFRVLMGVTDKMTARVGVPCTACRYCTTKCPMELDIPELMRMYNELKVTGGGFTVPLLHSALPEDKRSTACLGCQSCEEVCPQQIRISEVMSELADRLTKK